MKTLQNYTVTGALYRSDTGTPLIVGNLVKIFLDTEAVPSFPEFIYGVIQHPIAKINCDASTSYSIEYDEAELGGSVEFLRVSDVIDVQYASGGVGTVESVGLAAPNIFSVSGSPVTSAGTLTFALVTQTQAKFLGSPAGATGVPTFRAIVGGDISGLEISHVTNLQTELDNLLTQINNVYNELSLANGTNHMWKGYLAAEQPVADEDPRNYTIEGGTINSHGVSIDVPGVVISGVEYAYLAVTRNSSSRAMTGATIVGAASIPASTEATQCIPLVRIVDGIPRQLRFHEINVQEFQFLESGTSKFALVDMAAQNTYALPS